MSKDTKAPQAFPYSGEGDELNYSKGMTLRDYFAAKAMQTLLSAAVERDMTQVLAVPQTSYRVADAMLKARLA